MKLVIVACNTAAAAGLDQLRDECPVPVLGVIEPGVRALVQATRSGRVGVIGTVGTIGSGAYQAAVAAASIDEPVELTCAACPGFVEFVERDETGSDQVHVLAERLLAPVIDAKVDTLLLGCTHYPYLARTISDVMGRDVVLVSSADETAFEVRAELLGGGAIGRASGDDGWRAPLPLLGRRRDVPPARRPPARPRARSGGAHSMALSLTVLGCDGTYAGPSGACSGYLVQVRPTSVWVDTGPGTLAAAAARPAVDLDAIVVSHEHPDHWIELPVVRNALKYGFGVEGMRVITTRSVRTLMDGITHGRGADLRLGGGRRRRCRPPSATSASPSPAPTTRSRRWRCGSSTPAASLVYSADTGPALSFAALRRAASHLAVCEATSAEDDAGGVHLTGAEAGALAREAGAEHLVLTHLVPGTDPARRRSEAEAAYEGPVSVAAPGDTYEV